LFVLWQWFMPEPGHDQAGSDCGNPRCTCVAIDVRRERETYREVQTPPPVSASHLGIV